MRVRPVALVFVIASCSGLDPDEPIEAVPDSSWSASEVATLAAAAQCWNLRFGLDIEVTSRMTSPNAVYIHYDELACWQSGGRYLAGEPANIGICPTAAADYPPGVAWLFTVAEHELGHAAGILGTTKDLYSVMGGNFRSYPDSPFAFSAIDAQMFHDADPQFVPKTLCDEVAIIGDPVTDARCACWDEFRLAFISEPVAANVGVAGFDSLCQRDAAVAGLPGTYLAAVATSSSTIASRFGHLEQPVGSYYGGPSTPGTTMYPVATTTEALFTSGDSGGLFYGFDGPSMFFWTGAADAWTVGDPASTCDDWSSTSPATDSAIVSGIFTIAQPMDGESCGSFYAVLCLQQ
jgi:hypothetical protein